ncbi:MAG TPA: 2-dehydropantoate 2-reductase [Polyangia bacterium]|nr:2-dehydropantoate 2-reductase [Polyangia bacterium]
MQVLIQGVGGIGGVIAARLLAAGARPTLVTGNPAIAAALHQRGIGLDEHGETRWIPLAIPATAEVPPDDGPYDAILLVTQSTTMEAALRASKDRLAPHGVVVCLQNGLPEARAAALVGAERVVGGVVSWGASMVEPGRYRQTSAGRLQLGRPNGPPDAVVERLAAFLAPVGKVRTTDNLPGVRWSKLALNSAITTLGAVGGERLGEIVRHHYVRRLALEVFTELVTVAHRLGIDLAHISGTFSLESVALPRHADGSPLGLRDLWWRHAVLLAVGMKYRRVRSSMLYALERGRPPEVDYLNGEIVRHAEALGLQAPVNRRLMELVHSIAAGERKSSMELLRQAHAELIRA